MFSKLVRGVGELGELNNSKGCDLWRSGCGISCFFYIFVKIIMVSNLCNKVNEQLFLFLLMLQKHNRLITLPNACTLAFFFTLHIFLYLALECNLILEHTQTVAFISIGTKFKL